MRASDPGCGLLAECSHGVLEQWAGGILLASPAKLEEVGLC